VQIKDDFACAYSDDMIGYTTITDIIVTESLDANGASIKTISGTTNAGGANQFCLAC
jgi:hypothetical protein